MHYLIKIPFCLFVIAFLFSGIATLFMGFFTVTTAAAAWLVTVLPVLAPVSGLIKLWCGISAFFVAAIIVSLYTAND